MVLKSVRAAGSIADCIPADLGLGFFGFDLTDPDLADLDYIVAVGLQVAVAELDLELQWVVDTSDLSVPVSGSVRLPVVCAVYSNLSVCTEELEVEGAESEIALGFEMDLVVDCESGSDSTEVSEVDPEACFEADL